MATGTTRNGILLGVGIAAGVGLVLFGPALWRSARPLAKSTLKTAMEGFTVGKAAVARMSEEIEDLIVEAAYEMGKAETPTADARPAGADGPSDDTARAA